MPSSRPKAKTCPSCGSHLGMNPNCSVCQEHATTDASRSTAKVGGVTAVQQGAPRAFSSSGRVD